MKTALAGLLLCLAAAGAHATPRVGVPVDAPAPDTKNTIGLTIATGLAVAVVWYASNDREAWTYQPPRAFTATMDGDTVKAAIVWKFQ